VIDRLVPPQHRLGIFRPQPVLRLTGILAGVLLLAWAVLMPGGDETADATEPAREVAAAYADWKATPPDPTAARNTLRIHALRHPADAVARDLVLARERGWDAAFVDQFTSIVAWAVSVRAAAPDSVNAQAQRALSSGDAGTVAVGEALLAVADLKGHLPARLAAALRQIDGGDAVNGWRTLSTLARDGDFAPAQAELGRRYEQGDGIAADPRRALYWYMRAEAGGGDVRDRLGALQIGLAPDQRAEAEGWLAANTPPPE